MLGGRSLAVSSAADLGALVVRGWTVCDILGPGKVEPHALTSFARVDGESITYPAEPLFCLGEDGSDGPSA